MRKEFIKREVEDSSIYLCFAGFETIDSIVISNKVLGLNKFVVI